VLAEQGIDVDPAVGHRLPTPQFPQDKDAPLPAWLYPALHVHVDAAAPELLLAGQDEHETEPEVE
jgi:hypothetical protein